MIANTLTHKTSSTEGDSIKDSPFKVKPLLGTAHHPPSVVITCCLRERTCEWITTSLRYTIEVI